MRPAVSATIGVVRGAREDRLTGLAAEVAFFAALSVVPALVAIAAAITLVPRLGGATSGGEVEAAIVRSLERLLTDRAGTVIEAVEELFHRSNGDVFTLAIVGSLWSGSRGIDSVLRAVVIVSNDSERRPWWKLRLISFGALLATILVFAIALSMFVVGPLLGGGRAVAEQVGFGEGFAIGWRLLRLPLAVGALAAWALVLLHIARCTTRPWRSDLVGAAVTTALWVVASLGLRFYVVTVGSANVALGALGGPLIALVWLFLLAAALLVGAEVSQQLHGERRSTGRR